jgi:oxaloacetate decarboxylase beta subunit
LGIAKKYEPLLLVPIGLGILLVNLPFGGLMACEVNGTPSDIYVHGSQPVGILAWIFRYGIETLVLPCLIFLGLGALTDFGPLIANPKTLLLGAAAQLGIVVVFLLALLAGFIPGEAASLASIGGADGPITIFVTETLASPLIGIMAVVAYLYMAMVPIIQPPVINALTTKKERAIYMKPQLREVSRLERIVFPILVCVVIILLVPVTAPLIGCFMFGNLLRESGVTERLAETAGGSFMNICTILLGLPVGATLAATIFLTTGTLKIFALGIVAFAVSTAGGVLAAKAMNKVSKEPINPMIGAAGVSAVPMSARVVQRMGQKANPRNFLLMHAMGPQVAGVIATTTICGIYISMIG